MIDKFDLDEKIKNPEDLGSSPRIPNNEKYWKKLGKVGKKVMLYFHDDLDGIFSAVAMKKYLLSHGFDIIGYGVVNYMEGWDIIELDTKYINIAVDFAEITDDIDIYIDHHGEFKDDDNLKGKFAIKTLTSSAYEGIMDQLGLPNDKLVLDVIKMVDAAKYDEYDVAWTDLLKWDYNYFKNHKNPKLMFAGVFNQFLKRGDYRTFIEVVQNCDEPSIYKIYRLFKIFYPMNNLFWKTLRDFRDYDSTLNEQTIWEKFNNDEFEEELLVYGNGKPREMFSDFYEDGNWRINEMIKKTSGTVETKSVITSQQDFLNMYTKKESRTRGQYAGVTADVIKMDGYCIIGKLAYIPPGTWANAIRARAIIENDINTGRLKSVKKEDILWVLLQYGDTIQICSFGDIDEYPKEILPQTREGKPIDDLKVYCRELLERFKNVLEFNNENTLAGGHTGIGTISNIGVMKFNYNGNDKRIKKLSNKRYLDLFKNYMFNNLSEIKWDLSMSWENPFKNDNAEEPIPLNARVMFKNQIRLVDVNKSNKIKYPDNYVHKPNLGDLKRKEAAEKVQQVIVENNRTQQEIDRLKEKHNFYAKKSKDDNTTYEEWLTNQ